MQDLLTQPDFLEIFVLSFATQLICVVFKFISRFREIVADPRVTIDCCQNGVDLAILGMVTLLAIFVLSVKRDLLSSSPTNVSWLVAFILIQIGLLGGTAFMTAFFNKVDSAGWLRAFVLPFLLGWCSLILSMLLYTSMLTV